jgi:hypothetical protein
VGPFKNFTYNSDRGEEGYGGKAEVEDAKTFFKEEEGGRGRKMILFLLKNVDSTSSSGLEAGVLGMSNVATRASRRPEHKGTMKIISISINPIIQT